MGSGLTSLASGELLKDELEWPLDLCLLFATINSDSPLFRSFSDGLWEGVSDPREKRLEFEMDSRRKPPEVRETLCRGLPFSFSFPLLRSLLALPPSKEIRSNSPLCSGSVVRLPLLWLPEPEAGESALERRPVRSLEGSRSRTEWKAGSDKRVDST